MLLFASPIRMSAFRVMSRELSILPFLVFLTLFTFVANQLSINPTHTLIESRDLQIICNVSGSFSDDDYGWYKEGRDLTKDRNLDPRITPSISEANQLKLTIQNAKLSDVGDYHCYHKNQNVTTKVRTRPMLAQFEEFSSTNFRSANLVDGDNLTLNCSFLPDYGLDGEIKWYSMVEDEDFDPALEDEQTVNARLLEIKTDERINIETVDRHTKILSIKNVNPTDRMFYVCKANNPVGIYNNTILLRVKDRYAAMFPLLGILAEVIILCIVIFVYEKRRVKPDFDDNVNTSTPKKTTDDGNRSTNDRSSRSLDARQRK